MSQRTVSVSTAGICVAQTVSRSTRFDIRRPVIVGRFAAGDRDKETGQVSL